MLDDSNLNVSWNRPSTKTQVSMGLIDSSKNTSTVAGILFSSNKALESAEPLKNRAQLEDSLCDAQFQEAELLDSLDISLESRLPDGYYVACLDTHEVVFIPHDAASLEQQAEQLLLALMENK